MILNLVSNDLNLVSQLIFLLEKYNKFMVINSYDEIANVKDSKTYKDYIHNDKYVTTNALIDCNGVLNIDVDKINKALGDCYFTILQMYYGMFYKCFYRDVSDIRMFSIRKMLKEVADINLKYVGKGCKKVKYLNGANIIYLPSGKWKLKSCSLLYCPEMVSYKDCNMLNKKLYKNESYILDYTDLEYISIDYNNQYYNYINILE